jgi:predicted ThiF/HesA family dinucleotide-utilizing enzyme
LTCGHSFNYPITANSNILNRAAVEKNTIKRNFFIERLSPHTAKRGEDLVEFIKKLSISRVRAQAAVADYIQNHSLPRLARKLGHAHLSRDLLDSYLPTAIYDFFATRYVRIFQKGIICEAMKDSTYLLRASKFDKFEHLHEFLSRYTLKEVPENLKTREENLLVNGEVVEVGIAVSAESMTALVSIREAITLSKTPLAVRGLAKYWAEVCDTVEKYILKSHDKVMHAHLKCALKNCTPSAYENMIHAAS